MPRVVLLLPSRTYRSDFLDAAAALGVDVVVASDEPPPLDTAEGTGVELSLDDPEAGADVLVALHRVTPLDAVVAADDRGVRTAAVACARLGFPFHDPDAADATRDKARVRQLLAGAEIPQPRFAVVRAGAGDPPDALDAELRAAAEHVGFPLVAKPVALSASQGVVRVDGWDGERGLRATVERVRRISCEPDGPVLLESFVPGVEVAVEALVHGGQLRVLAVFDKPDPLDGPYFAETLYITPSRLPAALQARIETATARAAAAVGLREGPVHVELRVGVDGWSPGDDEARRAPVSVIEVAARSIGGLCSRTLRFGLGVTLEQLLLRHALGMELPPLRREWAASGVLMLPIPRAGVLERVDGQDEARAVPGVVGLEITVAHGTAVLPVPEGDRYLGFVFARGAEPGEVEHALREAGRRLRVVWR